MKPKLKRELGLFEAIFYGIGIIIGAGIFTLIGEAAGVAGNSVWLSFIIAAIVATFTGLSYAELSSMYPKASGEFIYVKKAYGSNFWAFIVAWLIIFAGIASVATVALGFAGYFNALFGLPVIAIAFAIIAILSFVNFLGIKESSTINIFLVTIQLIALFLVIVLGIGAMSGVIWTSTTTGKINYFDMPRGLEGVFIAVTLVFFAYLGFESIVKITEETKSPKKIIPRALILSIIITTVIYVLIAISAVSLAGWKELSESHAPLALVASKVLGEQGFWFLSFAALFATSTTILGILIFLSRMTYGMGIEKSLPKLFSVLHSKRRTPWIGIIILMIISMAFLLLGDIAIVAKITTLGTLAAFMAVNLSLIWLRYMRPDLKRPFRAPLNIGKYPVIGFLGVFTCFMIILQFDLELLLFGLGLVITGAIIYAAYIRKIIS